MDTCINLSTPTDKSHKYVAEDPFAEPSDASYCFEECLDPGWSYFGLFLLTKHLQFSQA